MPQDKRNSSPSLARDIFKRRFYCFYFIIKIQGFEEKAFLPCMGSFQTI
jgi:hypothetical protein